MEVYHRLAVNLDGLDGAWLLYQILGEHAHARAYLEHGQVGAGIYRVGYAPSYAQIYQEVLA